MTDEELRDLYMIVLDADDRCRTTEEKLRLTRVQLSRAMLRIAEKIQEPHD